MQIMLVCTTYHYREASWNRGGDTGGGRTEENGCSDLLAPNLESWSDACGSTSLVADFVTTHLHCRLYSLEISMSQPPTRKKRGKNSPRRRRGPRGWVSEEQCVHLTGEIPAFNGAQAEGNLAEFWPNMHVRFSRIYSQNPLTPEELEKGIRMEDKLAAELKVS